MRLRPSATLLAITLLSVAACSTIDQLGQLRPGASEAEATRLAHAAPGFEWKNADGTRTLEYSNEPVDGDACFMVTVDAAGKVLKVEQVVTDANIARIRTGMTQDEVRRILGAPRSVVHFPLSGEDVWDWNTGHGSVSLNLIRFNAHFKQGQLVRTSTRTIDPGDCSIISPC